MLCVCSSSTFGMVNDDVCPAGLLAFDRNGESVAMTAEFYICAVPISQPTAVPYPIRTVGGRWMRFFASACDARRRFFSEPGWCAHP